MKRHSVLLQLILLCWAGRGWGIDWEYSQSAAVSVALSEGKKVLLVAGQDTCGNCVYMKDTVMTASINQTVLEADYVCWDCEMSTCSEWQTYSGGLGWFSLPLICIIDPQSPNTYLERSTGTQTISGFNAWISGDTGSLVVLSIRSELGGWVTAPGEGDFSVRFGSSVSVTAMAGSGMEFYAWRGTAVDAGKVANPGVATTRVTMDADYTLVASFVRSTLKADRFEPDDRAGLAESFPVNGPPQERNIVPRGDVDWVQFMLERPARVTISVYGDEGDTELWLTDVATNILAHDDDSGQGQFSKIQSVLAAGTYYAKITSFSNHETIATYYLDIQADDAELKLTMESDSGGTTLPAPGDHVRLNGETQIVEALPLEGYVFTGWSGTAVDANKVAVPWSPKTTVAMAADCVLRAHFSPIQAYSYQGGSGTVLDPYRLGSPIDLVVLGKKPSDYQRHFRLVSNLDMAGHTFTDALIAPGQQRAGGGFVPFGGVFSGGGFAIQNLTVQAADHNDVGLFGVTDPNAVIENVLLQEAHITGGHYVGPLVGWNRGTVKVCAVTGGVKGRSAVGGQVGFNDTGSLENCYSHAQVEATEQWAGGLVGWNQGMLAHCFSTGSVQAPLLAGGLIGGQTGGETRSSFWDTQTSGQDGSAAGLGLSTTAMKDRLTYEAWESQTVWHITPGSYPIFAWQVPPIPQASIDSFPDSFFSTSWKRSGEAAWSLTSEHTISPPYCAQAGAITHDQASGLHLTRMCTEGEIHFWVKVSSEPIYDALIFSIDGDEAGRWSGSLDWKHVSFPVSAGVHDFAWEYRKDDSYSKWHDSAWIDDISQ